MSQTYVPAELGRATVRLLQLNHPNRVEEREALIAAGLMAMPGA